MEKLKVLLDFGSKQVEVGELVGRDKRIYFKYAEQFLDLKWEISPYHVKATSGILEAGTALFDGLFGVFDDSLPDGWGKLLVDRKWLAAGVSLVDINPLMRLAMVGNHGSGALVYQPEVASGAAASSFKALTDMELEVEKVLADKPSEYLEYLYQLGGSSGGARPKVQVGFAPKTGELWLSPAPVPLGFEHWLIKFRSTYDVADIAQVEYAYYLMAKEAGLEVSVSRLFEGKGDKHYFGTKRFDRPGDSRVHLHSAAALLQDNFRLSSLDYGHLMDAAFHLEKDIAAAEKVLRLAAFNVFSHNRDDHSKNTSFLMDDLGNWRLAPAYDLTFSQSAHGHHSISVAGESKSPGKKQLLQLANTFGVTNASHVLDQVETAVARWKYFAHEAGVSNAYRKGISHQIEVI
jgi:serine/threonine-protein kinase HipA